MTPPATPEAEMPRVHELKTWPVYFDAVARGAKTFEVRKDDRGFQKGDVLHLREWVPYNGDASSYSEKMPHYTGRQVAARVTWILTGGQFGIEPGYVVLAFAKEPTP